jgi:HlyD family secretion protein
MKKRSRKWILWLLVILALGGAVFAALRFIPNRAAAAANRQFQTLALARGPLQTTVGATGSVRANQTALLSWQTSGTVGAVQVALGDLVTAGQPLADLELTSLSQSIILAQADLVSAQRSLDDLQHTQTQAAQAQQAVAEAEQALEDLLHPSLTQAQAEQALADAQKAVEEAQRRFAYTQASAAQTYIDQARAQVVLTKDRLDKAQADFAPYENKPESNLVRANLLARLAQTQQAYDSAVRNLNSMLGTANPTDQAVAEANLKAAQASLAEAERAYQRLKDGPTASEIALAEARLADARREWQRWQEGPDPDDLAAAEARIAAAQAALKLAHLTAPFAGSLTQVRSQVGDQVTPGTVAFRLDDLSRLLVDVQVSEVDINQVLLGQSVNLTFDAVLGALYHGVVVEVASVGETTQGVVNFTVTVALTDADQRVRPGMTAAVNIVTTELQDVLLAPNRAVRTLDGKRVLYILKNNVPTPVAISLGESSDVYSEVLSGEVQAGDLVVLNPPATFGPGQGGGPMGGGGQGP